MMQNTNLRCYTVNEVIQFEFIFVFNIDIHYVYIYIYIHTINAKPKKHCLSFNVTRSPPVRPAGFRRASGLFQLLPSGKWRWRHHQGDAHHVHLRLRGCGRPNLVISYIQRGDPKIAFSWFTTPLTRVYGSYNHS